MVDGWMHLLLVLQYFTLQKEFVDLYRRNELETRLIMDLTSRFGLVAYPGLCGRIITSH